MADSPADPVEALAADNAPRWGLEADRLRASVAARLGITAAAPLRADRFVIGERLGAGGLGVVYAAEDPRLQRRVALKVLKQAKTPRARERLVREAQAMAALAHPNVVEVFDVLTADLDSGPALLIAMELVAGANLRTWLSAETRTWSETLAVFVQAAEGLGAAHRAGLVHRDFKPDNVLVGDDGRARVADFGLARAMMGSDCSPADEPEDAERSGALRGTSPLSSPLTADGVLVGTPAYMAPEQHGGTADAASDQFSFCVALYEALYGRRPFPGRVDASAAPALRRGPPPKRATSDVAPARLHTILARGLRLDPAQRWPNMEALANALRSISAPTRRGLPAASLAVAGAAVLVVL
ncbi:MAG: serine/threonine-protein kinase, partial [Myxococcota bacterium]